MDGVDYAVVGLDVVDKSVPVLRVSARHPAIHKRFDRSAQRAMVDMSVNSGYDADAEKTIDPNPGRVGAEPDPTTDLAVGQSSVGL